MPVTLSISSIRLDGGTQVRARIDPAVVAEYREILEALPPVIVFHDGTDHYLADGFHRVHAFKGAGRTKIPADVRPGTQRDAVLYSVGANASHGLRRTNDDMRRAVGLLLSDPEWSGRSNVWIAEACAVSHTFVAGLRPAPKVQPATVAGSPEPTVRTGRDGKKRKVPTREKRKVPRVATSWLDGWKTTGGDLAWRRPGDGSPGDARTGYLEILVGGTAIRIVATGKRLVAWQKTPEVTP